jgi:dihydroneopterin aldolase
MSRTQSRRIEAQSRHLVVKLGGSLWRSSLLKPWLAALRAGSLPITIVPGGGVFADAVRMSQEEMRFSDEAAHSMALLAMEQYALALADLEPGLNLVSSPAEARGAHASGRIALWRPFEAVSSARDIPPSWDVTSDSLAAWFAVESCATALVLVKSVDVSDGDDVVSLGVVDAYLSHYAGALPVFLAGPASLPGAAADLTRGRIPGRKLDARFPGRKIAI